MKIKKGRVGRVGLVVMLIAMFFPWNTYAEDNIKAVEAVEITKQVIIVKDELGLFIKDTVFEIQNNNGEVLETCIGDENGRIEIKKVEDGTYWLSQKQTQEGYQLIKDRIIEIKVEDPIREEVIINQKNEEEKKLEKDETEKAEKGDENFDLVPEEIVENEEKINNDLVLVEEIPDQFFYINDIAVEIVQSLEDVTKFKISTKGYAGKTGISKVMFPTWSEKNGQDDLRWYSGSLDSNGEYSVEIEIKDHGYETGIYNIHTYAYGLNGELLKVYCEGYQQEAKKAEMTVGEINDNTYCVQITGASNVQGVSGVVFPTWSNKDGQDDIKWVSGRYIGNDTWEAKIDLRDYHESYDTFLTHGYLITKDNEFKYINAIEKSVENPMGDIKVEVTKSLEDATKFKISTKGYAGKTGISKVMFPTWSEKNGQDDLRWYSGSLDSNGEYSVEIEIKDHGYETGIYNIHTYAYGLNGELLKVYCEGYQQEAKKAEMTVGEINDNTYCVQITGASNVQGVSGVVFPTWSNKDGQDDIKWVSGRYIGNDTWEAKIDLRDYHESYDTFLTHGYLITKDNEFKYINAIEKSVENPMGDIKVEVTKSLEDATKFKISTKGYAGKTGISKVMFPTWSEKNGQDDLRWYSGSLDSNGEYSVEIEIKDHAFETGIYNIHTYVYGLNGELLKVYCKKYQQEAKKVEMTVGEINANTYCVQITGVSNAQGVSGVVFPTWSNKNGQDDIKWVSGRYIGNDTWEAKIDLRDYHESYDTFFTHGYLITKDNEFKYINSIEKSVENPFIKSPIEIKIANGNNQSQFKIETVNCDGKIGLEGISFPVWTSKNGQDDIKWYSGKLEKTGEYSAIVDIEEHNFETGNYTIHAYVFGRKNKVLNVNAFAYKMEDPIPKIEYDKAVLNNIFKIRIKNLGNENGIKDIVFPTWSNKNGQDDIQWEKGTYIGNHTWEATINLRNYYGIIDDFISHAYIIDYNGKMIMTIAGCKTITQNTSTVYGDLLYPLDKIYKPNPNDPTDWFGPRWGRIHEGIDVPAPYYAKCYSPGDGIIEKAGYFMGYGRYVRIRMIDRYGESVSFFYGHLQEVNVCVGQTVVKGQLVGKVGGSGYNDQGKYVDDAYGPHLHFGAIANADDACVDPEIWIDFHNPYSNLK